MNADDFEQDFAKGPVKPLKRKDVSLKEDPSEKRASPLLAIKPIEKQALKIEKDKVQKVAAVKKPSPDKNQRPKLSK